MVVATAVVVENRIFWFCCRFRKRKSWQLMQFNTICCRCCRRCCCYCYVRRLYYHIISIVISEFQPSNRVDRAQTYRTRMLRKEFEWRSSGHKNNKIAGFWFVNSIFIFQISQTRSKTSMRKSTIKMTLFSIFMVVVVVFCYFRFESLNPTRNDKKKIVKTSYMKHDDGNDEWMTLFERVKN